MDYDVLVVGSGIGGMESALKLGDMGYKVLVVEKEPSVGGKMILLSKVFPTLDCASCISTPKMAATVHHPNVTVFTGSEVGGIVRNGTGSFRASVRRKPRFVDESLCTGCRQCELACTVAVPDQFNGELVSRRAAYIAFPQAVPQKALIERAGTSPCTFSCPAGIKAHGYVSLVRSGEYEKAFDLVLETTPLVGSLGRACYAPCEAECTRGSLEGPLPIRRLKRFVADTHYSLAEPPPVEAPAPNGKRVAVVGSGPAGLTAAWQLARQGYGVKIFEAAPVPGGALRLAIPSYRLPAEVVERDVANVTAAGVEIATNARVDDLDALQRDGFDAVLVATGTPNSAKLRVPGEELHGVSSALGFLRSIKLDEPLDVRGKTVTVIGGGNVAIDAARSARRLGAAQVHMVCLESRAEMPAYAWEVDEALADGVELHDSWGISSFQGADRVEAVELKRCDAVFDENGRFSPQYDEHVVERLACDVVIVAIGMGADTATFAALAPDGARTLQADPATLQTSVRWVFAAGDAVTGPVDDHGRRRAGPQGRPHDRPLAAGTGAHGLRGAAAGRRPGRGARAAEESQPPRPARRERELRSRAHRLRRARAAADRGGGARRRGALPRLRRLLGVPRVPRRVPRRRDRLRHARAGGRRRGRRGDRLHRLQGVSRRPEAAVRLRPVPERDHGRADGASPRADPPVQHRAAARRRQGPRADRLRHVHRLAGRRPSAIRSARSSAACTRSSRTS